MKLYIAAKMTGEPQFNFPSFFAAEAALEAMGHTCFNPARKDMEDGFDPSVDIPRGLSEYMIDDVPALLKCEGVCVLPGWERSRGACFEVFTALYFGMPVLAYPSMEPIKPFVPFVAFVTCKEVMDTGSKKHGQDSWFFEDSFNHLGKSSRHALTAALQRGGFSPLDGENHAKLSLCRAAMAVAKEF